MICIFLELWGLREPVWKVNGPFMMNVANCYDWYLVDQLIHVEFPRLSVAGFQFWPWPVIVSVSCPGRHGVVWSGLGLGWMLLMNWSSPSVAALPRPTATWTWWLKSLLFSWYFSFCMSHVVGEVTYVELFKDAEGKSRVSDVGDSLQEVLKAPGSFFKKKLTGVDWLFWVCQLPNWRWVVSRAWTLATDGYFYWKVEVLLILEN